MSAGGTSEHHVPCAYPWQQMNIDLTGEVVPCCFWSGYGNSGRALGNTNEQSLLEIWNGPAWQELRRVNAEGPAPGHPCHQCLAWKWSGGSYPTFRWPVAFAPESGRCHTGPIPERFRAEIAGAELPVVLREDGVELPHPDALHDDIRALGGGRYSVWGDTLYFSSSDDSDPATNGRRYELCCGSATAALTSLRRDSTSGQNLLLARAEYEAGATTLAAQPTLLAYISTADCNIDCPACSQNTVRLLKVQHRAGTEEQVLALVPYLHQFIWHGGEPYLIQRFREFIDGFTRESNPNLTFGFTSNGTLLDAAELDKLLRFPRINASVSVDSFVARTFREMRAGARFETVLANVLAAVKRYDAPDFVISVGMIVTKGNLAELPANLAFAFEHGIGLNLSPVVVYPVTERLDVFADFRAQSRGFVEALDGAQAVLARARAAGSPALKRVDPAGMLAALRQIVARAAERYAEIVQLAVSVEDPTGALAAMRRPGLIVLRDDDGSLPLAYLELDRGPGRYQLLLPRQELAGRAQVYWTLVHDLLEPMGILDQDPFRDDEGRSLPEAGWRVMPTELRLEVPPFAAVPRPRNPALSHRGLPTADGLSVTDPAELFGAYQALRQREAAAGHGVSAARPQGRFGRPAGERRAWHYAGFTSLEG